jgi:hypothetical protein
VYGSGPSGIAKPSCDRAKHLVNARADRYHH